MIQKINNNQIYISVDTTNGGLLSLCDVHAEEYLLQNIDENGEVKATGICGDFGELQTKSNGANFRVVSKNSDRIQLTKKQENITTDIFYELFGNSLCIRYVFACGEDTADFTGFSLGGGFGLPFCDDEAPEDYFFTYYINTAVNNPQKKTVYINSAELTDKGITVCNPGIKKFCLLSGCSGKGIEVSYESFGNLHLNSTAGTGAVLFKVSNSENKKQKDLLKSAEYNLLITLL